jgi:poly-gamma-glutamate capsule biosynthesis protein CapA/YwtB (metallophosphatase superfamily)
MVNTSFLTGGDVAPIRKIGRGIFGSVAPLFQRADVSFFNLELPLSDRGESVRGKAICHRGLPVSIDGIAEAGVSCVNLANNHVLDYGDVAMFDTFDLLDRKAIGRFGAGRNIDDARKGYVVEKNGLRIGFLGYTTTLPTGFAATSACPGVNPLQAYTAYQPRASLTEYPGTAPRTVTWTDPVHLERLRRDVELFRKQVNVLLIYVHWGTSMSPQVHDFQREIARAAIDAGAHAVFGGHQHVISAIEFYRNCPVVYGSGNLLFDTRPSFFTEETLKTFLFGASIGPDGLNDCHLLPVKTGVDMPPRLLSPRDALWTAIYEDLQKHSGALGTQLKAREDAIEVRCN